MGVYCVTNSRNGKILLGSALNVRGILNSILFQLQGSSYPNEALQKDFNAQEEADFSFKVVDYLKPKDDLKYDYRADLKALEELWLEKLQPYGEAGYNIKKTAR